MRKQPHNDRSAIDAYHAHIYYTPQTRPVAERLREELDGRFIVKLGRWHDVPVGPHPIAIYQVAFASIEFATLVPWLMTHRAGLNIMVHPLTGDDYEDHASHALWLGESLPLRLETLRQIARPDVSRSDPRGILSTGHPPARPERTHPSPAHIK